MITQSTFDKWITSLTTAFSRFLDDGQKAHWYRIVQKDSEPIFIETITRLSDGQRFPSFSEYRQTYKRIEWEKKGKKKPWESEHGCSQCRDGFLHVYARDVPEGNRVRVDFLHQDAELKGDEIEYTGYCRNCFPEKEKTLNPSLKWKFIPLLSPKLHREGVGIPRVENQAMMKLLNKMIQQPQGVVDWEKEAKKKMAYHRSARDLCIQNNTDGLTVNESQEIRKSIDGQWGTWENQYALPF